MHIYICIYIYIYLSRAHWLVVKQPIAIPSGLQLQVLRDVMVAHYSGGRVWSPKLKINIDQPMDVEVPSFFQAQMDDFCCHQNGIILDECSWPSSSDIKKLLGSVVLTLRTRASTRPSRATPWFKTDLLFYPVVGPLLADQRGALHFQKL